MKLIDADAATYEVYECDEPMTHKDVRKLLREQPVVDCEQCGWSAECGTHRADRSIVVCDNFERRQPCPHCGATPCLGDIRGDDL